jgi:hypothetical protein
MKQTFFEILKFLAGLAYALFWFYLCYKGIQQRSTKDLGDGGIQTLFGNQKHK